MHFSVMDEELNNLYAFHSDHLHVDIVLFEFEESSYNPTLKVLKGLVKKKYPHSTTL